MDSVYEKGYLKIDLEQLIDSMDADVKKKILKSLSTTSDVIDWVLNYICDDDEDGWWHGSAVQTRQDFLEKVEQTQLGNSWVSCYWKPWGELRDKLKEIESQRETYKRLKSLMRDYDSSFSEFLRKHFDGDECSHYTTKLADKKIKEIEKLVINTLNSMKKTT